MTALRPLESANLADCVCTKRATDDDISKHLKSKHVRMRFSGCLAESVTEKLQSCVDDIARQTALGPILGPVEDLHALFERVHEQHLYSTEVRIQRDVHVRVEPCVPVVHIALDLVVTITLGAVTVPRGSAPLETTAASVRAALDADGLQLYEWDGEFGVYEIDLTPRAVVDESPERLPSASTHGMP